MIDLSNNSFLSESNQQYLQMMKDIYEVSSACSTKTYIWGGFAMDILEGRFLRDHGDLDGFVENMMSVLEKLMAAYQSKDYQTEFLSNINMLVIRKGKQHAAFNPLDVDGSVAMWRHIGDQGTVYFPFSWLDSAPRDFYGIKVYTSGPCFEYGFRGIAGSLNPEWKEREKDRIARAYLEAKIREENIDAKTISSRIWSYNPCWAKMGYDPFSKPTLVWPMMVHEPREKHER